MGHRDTEKNQEPVAGGERSLVYIYIYIIDLDDGKIETGKPYIIFDGKNPWVSG